MGGYGDMTRTDSLILSMHHLLEPKKRCRGRVALARELARQLDAESKRSVWRRLWEVLLMDI